MVFGQSSCCELAGLSSACCSCGKYPPTLVHSHGISCIAQYFASDNSPVDNFVRIAKQVFLTAFSDEGTGSSVVLSYRTGQRRNREGGFVHQLGLALQLLNMLS